MAVKISRYTRNPSLERELEEMGLDKGNVAGRILYLMDGLPEDFAVKTTRGQSYTRNDIARIKDTGILHEIYRRLYRMYN